MTTKQDLIKQFRDENPTITSTINGESVLLNAVDYEKTLSDWVEMRLEQIALDVSKAQAEIDKAQLLTKLGISPDEAKLLLS